MPHRSKDIIRAAQRGAAREGGTIVSVSQSGNHQMVIVEKEGLRRKVFLPLSSIDRRGEQATETTVRRVIRGMKPPKAVSEFLWLW